MTREEKQKAIDALKISAPVMAVTQEEFNDYIQTLNQVMDWLEQEPCEDAISRQAVLVSIKNLYPDMPIGDIFGARRKWLEKYAPYFECENAIEQLPSVTPQQRIGHCKDCKHFRKLPYHADALGKCIHHGGFCPKGDWYCADFEPQEGE